MVTVWVDDEEGAFVHAASAATTSTPTATSRTIAVGRAKPPSEPTSVRWVRFHIAAPKAPIRVTGSA